MKLRAIYFVFLLLILSGGVMAYRTGRERSRLSIELQRLSRKTGEIAIADPSRAYYRAIKTGDPLSFAWHVYLPPGYKQILRQNGKISGSSTNTNASEFIARVRFRENKNGSLDFYTSSRSSSVRSTLGSPALAALLRDRWDQLLIEQLGSTSTVSPDPNDSVVVLEVKMPPDFEEEAKKVLKPDEFTYVFPRLFRLELGREKPKL